MDEFTPTIDQVRETWVEVQDITFGEGPDAHGDEFNRWLNEERAKVWDLARSEVRSIPSWYNPETGKGGFDLQPLGPDASSEEGAWNAVMEILDQNPYRKTDQ